ncbi:MAG TPA: flagellar basal-body MS-ring/collar protein FliF [Solirubrobacteraceae bacterium]|nr:flagellar basal-body MS-ring/collar protein FliF [Solirubrobacteraceae bacterium]
MDIRQFVSRLSPKGWAMVGASVAAGILFLVVVMHFASAPSYTTLETGLDPAQTGKITSTLDAKGIGYQIENGGTALAVSSSQVSEARIALATAGLLGIGSEQPGFELLNSSQLGASDFQQQVTYQRALEGQLDQTIEQIQGVDSATVNLVLPNQQDELFGEDSQSSSGSVLLDDDGSLSSSSIQGIANLVASSVQGLSTSKVTITDSSGALLWPTSGGDGGSGSGLPAAQSADQQYDSTMTSQVDAMLTQTLGPGKAQVVVNGNLNTNQSTQQSLTYGKKGVPLTSQTSSETLAGGSGTSGGTTGTIPAYAGTTGSSGNSNYKNTSNNTTYGVDKTITNSTITPGTINNQTVSVLVDKSVPASELPAIRNAVAGAVGLDAKRGDALTVSQIAFTKAATPAATAATSNKMLGYAKYVIIGLGSLIFLFLMRRSLKRRERETFEGQPTWLRELATPRPLAALASGGEEPPTEVKRLRSPVNVPKRQVEELVERDPDRVAQQVRAWMVED